MTTRGFFFFFTNLPLSLVALFCAAKRHWVNIQHLSYQLKF